MSVEARAAAIRDVIRYGARSLRGEFDAATGLIEACYAAWERQVPEVYLMPGVVLLRRAVAEYGFDDSSIPPALAPLVEACRELAREQSRKLREAALHLAREYGVASESALLLGQGALLAGLYRDLGAFPLQSWAVGVPAVRLGAAGAISPNGLAVTPLSWLERLFDEATVSGQVAQTAWRLPRPELLIAQLAAQVGDALAHPLPPTWPHLAMAIKSWQHEATAREVLDMARELGCEDTARTGLAIILHLFPEVERWVSHGQLAIPTWELRFAIPLAARKLVSLPLG